MPECDIWCGKWTIPETDQGGRFDKSNQAALMLIQYDLISKSGGSEVEEMHLCCFSISVASSNSIIFQFLKVNAIGNGVDHGGKSGQIYSGPLNGIFPDRASLFSPAL